MRESSNDIYFLKLSHDITKQSQIADDVVPSRRKLINITQALHVFSLCYLSYNKEQLTKLLLGVIIHL